MTAIEITKEIGKLEKNLFEFALKLTKDKVEADDLYQETAYRAIKNSHQFKPNTNLKGWLITIMRNIFINAYRRKRIRQTFQDGSANNYLLESLNNSVTNDGAIIVDYEELRSLINKLEDFYKVPFILAYQGYKYDEIATELNIPLGTVKSRIYMAKRQLRALIKAYYGASERHEMYAA